MDYLTPTTNKLRRISLLGSTGSIGRQTLEVAAAFPDKFKIVALTANRNWELLACQAKQFSPRLVAIADHSCHTNLKEALKDTDIEIVCGTEGLQAAATLSEADIVVGALVGYSGLLPVTAALENGKSVALANKETLVVAGEIIEEIVARKGKRILPVDSEHSAIFQCLWGEESDAVDKIILTASGGPFRDMDQDSMASVTVEQALRHPNWDMGAKVTIDSATMMNKGFEMIEARWLFHKSPADIEVVVHPESVVHSMVEFIDGSVKAQLGLPDMRLPICIALCYPDRVNLKKSLGLPRLNLAQYRSLTFKEPDLLKFPLLKLAYDVAEAGGLNPAVMNAANEVAVKAFLERKINFPAVSKIVCECVEKLSPEISRMDVTLQNIREVHIMGTNIATDLIKTPTNNKWIHF